MKTEKFEDYISEHYDSIGQFTLNQLNLLWVDRQKKVEMWEKTVEVQAILLDEKQKKIDQLEVKLEQQLQVSKENQESGLRCLGKCKELEVANARLFSYNGELTEKNEELEDLVEELKENRNFLKADRSFQIERVGTLQAERDELLEVAYLLLKNEGEFEEGTVFSVAQQAVDKIKKELEDLEDKYWEGYAKAIL